MGTRHIIIIIADEKTKVAQYSQWDGNPEAQGVGILKWIANINLDRFKEKVRKLRWITNEEMEAVKNDKNSFKNYPYLSRDASSEIIRAIMFGEIKVNLTIAKNFDELIETGFRYEILECEILGLINQEQFAGDSLSCEWGYVIDLDKRTFEVYEGFSEQPIAETERFHKFFQHPKHREKIYYPIRIVKSYSLDALPTEEEFIDFFEKKYEAEDAAEEAADNKNNEQ